MTEIDAPASHPTKRVRVTLVAYKRLECSCIIEVNEEAAFDNAQLQKLQYAMRDQIDESAYEEDSDYWKESDGKVERAHPDDDTPVSYRAVHAQGGWHLQGRE